MFTTRPELTGTFGMVSSTHWLASQAGMATLERGGNAFDAAVAAGFVLQVVEPHLNGLGGEVPIVGWVAVEDRPVVVCGQGVAPAAARPKVFADLGLSMVPETGLLPACVPGAFGAWMLLLKRYGTMPLAEVLGYAIDYAGDGFPVVPKLRTAIDAVADVFRSHWPTSAATWLVRGEAPPAGSRLRNPVLAATYQRLATAGDPVDAYYRGFVAAAIHDFCASSDVQDAAGRPDRGLLVADDLARWQATEEEPVHHDYQQYRILKPGPWSQGPVFGQQLAILDGMVDGLDTGSPGFIHTVVEAAKLSFADREAYYGDPDFAEVPLDVLLSRAYNDERRTLITDRADVGELRPGRPSGRTPRLAVVTLPAAPTGHAVGEPTAGPRGQHRGETCHVDVADRWGNLVSATPSGGWLQGSPTIPGLGFCLGTRAQTFWLQPGLPNSLEPCKRPRTTLSPTLALRDGRPYLAFGTPGGDQQDQWSLAFFLRHVRDMNLQEAIDAPAWHTTHFPSSFYPRGSNPGLLHVESRLGDDTIRALRARGHQVVVEEPWSLGSLSAVARDHDGLLRAAANPRGMQGYAVGR